MKRKSPLAALLLISVAAGLWLAWPGAPRRETLTAPASSGCGEGETCQAPTSADAPKADRPSAAPAPAGKAGPRPAAPEDPLAPPPPSRILPLPPSPATPLPGLTLRETADTLIAAGYVKEGVAAFREAVNDNPSPANHGDLGMLLERLTAFDEAAQHLRLAADLDPTNADRWIALANLYYLKTSPGEAWMAERRAREAEPGLALERGADGLLVRRSDSADGKR